MGRTRIRWLRGLCLVVGIGTLAAAEPPAAFPARVLSFYEVKLAAAEPVVDGRLDDAAWHDAAPADNYYKYWDPAAIPADLKSEYRLVYSAKGVFLGITNYDEHADQIRAAKVARDDPNLWQDDCAEIFFDPSGLTIGYTKFTVNALGTMGDMRRVDAAVSQNNWSGSGWQVKTGRGGDRWTIEAFFPWSDLGGTAKPGDIWRFCHVRYAYSSGKFQGATSSPGGNYHSPEGFGFLLFSPEGGVDAARIGEALGRATPPPWALPLRDGFLVSTRPGSSDFCSAADLVRREQAAGAALSADVLDLFTRLGAPKAFAEKVQALQAAAVVGEASSTPAGALKSLRELSALTRNAQELRWTLKIYELLDGM